MTWLLVFVIMLLVVFGMSIGVIMGRKPIAGSCGGIANHLGIEKECSICGGDRQKCEETNRDESVVPENSPTTRPNANVRHFARGVHMPASRSDRALPGECRRSHRPDDRIDPPRTCCAAALPEAPVGASACSEVRMAVYNYDVVILGTGPAGEGAAMNASKYGRKLAVVDSRRVVGGNCTHLGTIPSRPCATR